MMNSKMVSFVIGCVWVSVFLFGAGMQVEGKKCPPNVPTNNTISLEAYQGVWYQIATNQKFENSREKGLVCVEAIYTLEGGSPPTIKVNNTGIYGPGTGKEGQVSSAIGKAKQVEGGKLKVSFFADIYGPYWVTQLYGEAADGYSVAVIWSCEDFGPFSFGNDLWVLSRTRQLPPGITLDSIYAVAQADGIDVKSLAMENTVQTNCP